MKPVTIERGNSPLVLGQPHSGTFVPEDILANLTPLGQELGDTDWHIPRLYEGLAPDATVVRANFNRYVIDANRDPNGTSLYPGQNTTGLVPLITFDDHPIWLEEPTEGEIQKRLEAFHTPYHEALQTELMRIKDQHGYVVLYDCHSIRSHIPHLFEGELLNLNIGTFDEKSCAPAISETILSICREAKTFTSVLNGRFKGGWTTRHYGDPTAGVHAVQMELTQASYMQSESPPFLYDTGKAENLRRVLKGVLEGICQLDPAAL